MRRNNSEAISIDSGLFGADGHPADGPFLPPIPGRRRMFAGGRLRHDAPIPVGAEPSLIATASLQGPA